MQKIFNGIIRELKQEDTSAVESIFDLYWSGKFREQLSQRLEDFVSHSMESIEQRFRFFVAEENGEVVGVAALRKAPERMRIYSTTTNPAEFYVLAAKYKGKGVGTALREKRIEEARKSGYTEVVFYSGDTHKDSWNFHDDSDFKRVGTSVAPDGEPGQIWRMVL